MRTTTGLAVAALAAVVTFLGATRAMAQAPMDGIFAKKTITLTVGYAPGGGYDLYARLVGCALGRYLPGQPSVVVQKMPGRQPAGRELSVQGRTEGRGFVESAAGMAGIRPFTNRLGKP